MKNIILIVITVISFTVISIPVSAQNYTTTYNDIRFTKNEVLPTFTVYTENTFKKDSKVGYNMFVLVTKDWAEAYPGVFYKMSVNDVIGVAVGLETTAPYYRFAGSYLHFGDTKGMFFNRLLIKSFIEVGGGKSNYWYHVSIDYQTKDWRIGPMSRRFYGTGLRIEYQKDHTKFMLGGASLYDTEIGEWKPTIFIGWNF